MDTTDWLIAATVAAPVLTTLVTPGFIGAILRLARARAQRIKYVDASGSDLYHRGVPMTETQFREMIGALCAALDELPPCGERTEWEMQRQHEAQQRVAVLTGRHPHAFPSIGSVDDAWHWYAENNPYVTGILSTDPLTRRPRPGFEEAHEYAKQTTRLLNERLGRGRRDGDAPSS